MDSRLLKRLVGAAVLIALAVIFVPMLLPGGSPSGSKDMKLGIPPESSAKLQTRVIEVGPGNARAGLRTTGRIVDPDHVTTVDLNQHPTGQQPTDTGTSAAGPSDSPAQTRAMSAPNASRPTPSASANATAVPGGGDTIYRVNLGIYADQASAKKLVAAARKHGFTAKTTPEKFDGKPVLRVRVGPFASRIQASAARSKLHNFEPVSSMTIQTNAAHQTANAPASTLAASKPGTWAVQLGAFRVQGQANMLRDRLRNQGFDGYVDNPASKSKLYRVRVGPFTTRDKATATLRTIHKKMKIKGIVVTQR